MDRRTFIKAAAAGAGVASVGGAAGASSFVNVALPSLRLRPPKARTPAQHVVVLMQENRSVDHFLGWYAAENPDFDAGQHATYIDRHGRSLSTANWGVHGRRNYHGRHFEDPGHGWDSGRAEFNGGACDGFLSEGSGR